jgi:hypothetical protein
MAEEVKRRFCSTGSHWTSAEFKKIGTVRWICIACYRTRQAELKNRARNQRLAAIAASKPIAPEPPLKGSPSKG